MADRFVLPAAKLAPARMGLSLLPRPELTEGLRRGVRTKLLVLSAEAGYGKTALLLSSLGSLGLPVAWVTLDERDTDANLFAAAIVLALRRVASHVGDAALELLGGGPSDAVLCSTMHQTLEELPEELALVLDDFHVLDATPPALALVDHLLEYLPATVHVIIASRTRPALRGLPRLLLTGEATGLSRDHLAFTPEETAAFLRQNHGLEVDAQQARLLTARTEGWPAAIRLAALAGKERGALELSGTPREIFDYLASAVLDALDPPVRQFLARTSVLWELTPGACTALTDMPNTDALLELLDQRNLFMSRLDAAGSRYRYHQLFAEFLQHRLSGEEPGRLTALHVRAGRYLESVGAGDQAVRHFLAAGAYDDAVRVLMPYRAGRLTAQRAYTFRDLVQRLPEGVANRYPGLLRTAASSCRFIGDYERALDWSRRAAAASDGHDVNLWAHSVHGVVVMLMSMGRLREAIATAEAALARLPDGIETGLAADLYLILSMSRRLAGRLTAAEEALARGTELASVTAHLDGIGQACLHRGWLAITGFTPSAALEGFRAAAQVGEEHHSPYYQASAHAGRARALLDLGELEAAAEALAGAEALHAQAGERSIELQLGWTRGDLALARGDLASARQAYRHVLGLCREGESERLRILAELGLARVSRADGRAEEALTHVGSALTRCRASELGSLLPLALLETVLALRQLGRFEEAQRHLAEAGGILRTWMSGPGMARCALLEAQIRRDVAPARTGLPAASKSLARAVTLATLHRHDLRGWLRAEAAWLAPLLANVPAVAGDLMLELGRAALAPLVGALESPRARLGAIRVLGRIGEPSVRRALAPWARRGDAEVRKAAAAALRRLPAPGPPALRIHLLGPFEAFRDGEPIPDGEWRTRKVKALVKYLLLANGRHAHREEIIDALWPGSAPSRGAVNLKTAVKLARRALEPNLEGAASHFLRWQGDVLTFSSPDLRVDIEDYERARAEAREHQAAGRLGEASAALEAVVGLYRGDLLEPEDRYEEWAGAHRDRWRRIQLETLTSLAQLEAGRGDYCRSAETMHRVLALEPGREAAYRHLMKCALLQGDRSGAVAIYRRCTVALRQELGVAPDSATTRLFEEARRP